MLSDIEHFAWDVINNWAGYSTGGLILACVVLWFGVKEKTMPRKVALVLAALFLLMAFFKAWQDKSQKLIALQAQLKSPGFSGQLGSAWWGSYKGKLLVIVGGVVTNPFGPPSAAINWKMSLEFPGSPVAVDGVAPFTSGKDQSYELPGEKAKMVLAASNYLPEKSATPIPGGGAMAGWFWSVFNGLSEQDMYKNPELIVSFDDVVDGRRHCLKMKVNKKGKGITLPGD